MTDDEIELQLRGAFRSEAAEFALAIDRRAVRARLAVGAARRQQSRRGTWLILAAAAIAIVAVGAILAAGSRHETRPGQATPAASRAPSPPPIAVDPGWRLAVEGSGAFTTRPSNAIPLRFTLPADATRWALKISCVGASSLVVFGDAFAHTVSCDFTTGSVSRAVYRVENHEIATPLVLGVRTDIAAAFQVIIETTASELDDPLTVDPSPGPEDVFAPPPEPAPLAVPPSWGLNTLVLNGDATGWSSAQSDSPPFRAGRVELVLSCVGTGSVNVLVLKETNPGAGLGRIPAGSGQVVPCTGSSGQVRVTLAAAITGTENAVEGEGSSADPNARFVWSLAVGQAP